MSTLVRTVRQSIRNGLPFLDSARGALTLLSEADPVVGDFRTIFWECMNGTLGTSIGPYRDNGPQTGLILGAMPTQI